MAIDPGSKDCLSFWVPGIPVPKGSAKAFMRRGMKFPVVIQDNSEKQKPWASLIALTASNAIDKASLDQLPKDDGSGSLSWNVYLEFRMPRPKAHFGKNGLKGFASFLPHTKKPDLDKLTRLVFDALTGVVWADDSQVTGVNAIKKYAAAQLECGVHIHLEAHLNRLNGVSA